MKIENAVIGLLSFVLIVCVGLMVFVCFQAPVGEVKQHEDGRTTITNGLTGGTVYIIEREGFKFAVAVQDGGNGISICQIIERK